MKLTFDLDGVAGMESAHPGLIDAGENGCEEVKDLRKEFTPLQKVDEHGKTTHTPEYDQVGFIGSFQHISARNYMTRENI